MTKLEVVERNLVEKEAELARAHDSIQKLTSEVSGLRSREQELDGQVRELRSSLEKAEVAKDEVSRQLAQVEESSELERQKTLSEARLLGERLSDVQAELSESRRIQQEREQETRVLEVKVRDLSVDRDQAEASLRELRQELRKRESEVEVARSEMDELRRGELSNGHCCSDKANSVLGEKSFLQMPTSSNRL